METVHNLEVPEDVMAAAWTLSQWAAKNNLTDWRILNVRGAVPNTRTPNPELKIEDYNLDQWWAHELRQLAGDSEYQQTLDTRRAAGVALDFVHLVTHQPVPTLTYRSRHEVPDTNTTVFVLACDVKMPVIDTQVYIDDATWTVLGVERYASSVTLRVKPTETT